MQTFPQKIKIRTHKYEINIGEQEFVWKNQVKYLGILLGRRLSFDAHIYIKRHSMHTQISCMHY